MPNALAQRIVTAAVLVALLLPAFLVLPKVFGLSLIALFVLGAAWEWSAFLGYHRRAGRLAYVVAMAGMIGIAEMVVPGYVSVATVAALSMLWWAYAFEWILRFPVPIGRPAALVSGVLVLLPAWVSLVALLYTSVDGRKLLLLALATVWAADVGAYFAGRRFGRVKLAPRVSPGKTWEGVIGGLVCAALTAAAGAAILGHPVAPALPLGLSVGGYLGRRRSHGQHVQAQQPGLKDSGNLFPGPWRCTRPGRQRHGSRAPVRTGSGLAGLAERVIWSGGCNRVAGLEIMATAPRRAGDGRVSLYAAGRRRAHAL